MATILTKKSDTASAVPLAADLTNAAGGAELAVNATDKRLFSKTSGGTVVELGTNPSTLVLPSGSANGVAYLNGSKVVTSGSALTFDGSFANLTLTSGTSANGFLQFSNSADGGTQGYIGDSKALISGGANSSLAVRGESNILFGIASAEQMRLTSTGLGIGTSSPSEKLEVVGNYIKVTGTTNQVALRASNTGGDAYFGIDNSAGSNFNTGTAYAGVVWRSGANPICFVNNSSEKMRLDSSGNLGLGVTPSAYGTTYKAIQAGVYAAFVGDNNNGRVEILNNAYASANNVFNYSDSNSAGRYSMQLGEHKWFSAGSGTAGNAITFTQAATLTADGNFLVGTTSFSYNPTQGATISGGSVGAIGIGHASGTADGNGYLNFAYNGTNIGSVTQNSTTSVAYNTSSDYRLKNITGPITNSGAYIDSLNPVEGTWKADGSTFVGLIAHEVQEASRTPVATGTKDGAEMQAMDYSNSELIANLIAEVKSLRKRLADAGL